MRKRLGDREAAPRSGKVRSEERERELVSVTWLSPERAATVSAEAEPVMFLQLARASGRIIDRLPVTGQRDPRLELDRAVERSEVVPERIGPALAGQSSTVGVMRPSR